MDRDLSDEMLKLVRYKVLFVRREYETAFEEQEDLVQDNMDPGSFTAWKIATFIQDLSKKETPVPRKWIGFDPQTGNEEVKYPGAGFVESRNDTSNGQSFYLTGFPDDDKKYLRVYFEVLDRYPREAFKYEEQQIHVLEEIRDHLDRLGGGGVQNLPVQENEIGMALVEIPAGEFRMGSSSTDEEAQEDEKPRHLVRITRSFLIGVSPVTVGQFGRFVTETGYQTVAERDGKGAVGLDLVTGLVERKPEYHWKFWLHDDEAHPSDFEQTHDHPVVCVGWDDVQEFLKWLTEKTNREYRLPTEAEWEYACRAGTETRYCNGDDGDGLLEVANIADASLQEKWVMEINGQPTHLPPYAKPWDDGYPFTSPVKRFEPNQWGLYDVHGNVGEWCRDWYHSSYYLDAPVEDPAGPAEGEVIDLTKRLSPQELALLKPDSEQLPFRVIRGGVWLDPASGCRCADRQTHLRHPIHSAADVGFRVVASTTTKKKSQAKPSKTKKGQ